MKPIISALILAGVLLANIPAGSAAENGAPEKKLLGISECISMALKAAPELGEAQADIDLTASKLDEAKSYRYPQLEAIALLGPAPGAHSEDFRRTDKTFRFSEMTWFAGTDATLIQPLYTFGKISENMKAATHGIEVDRSRKEQRANEIVLKVREYYNGLLLAREMKELLLEVQESLDKARTKARKLVDQGSDSVDEMDIYKLDAFTGEVTRYKEEALKGEALALAALKSRVGLPPNAGLEIRDERLTAPEEAPQTFDTLVDKSAIRRPEYRQIAEGLKARAALVDAAKANYYPDIFLGGMFSWAYADQRDRLDNPYVADRFKHTNGGVALGARWKLDFGITGARVAAEQAQYNRLLSTKDFAETNIPLQIKKIHLELQEAGKSIDASKEAYTNAKKWAVTALANFDFGVGPAKEIFVALQAYARMRASYFQSIYNYRIAQANLDYATGETAHSVEQQLSVK